MGFEYLWFLPILSAGLVGFYLFLPSAVRRAPVGLPGRILRVVVLLLLFLFYQAVGSERGGPTRSSLRVSVIMPANVPSGAE